MPQPRWRLQRCTTGRLGASRRSASADDLRLLVEPARPHRAARWTRDAVRSAVAQVGKDNRSKIYVGLHQYGKAWYAAMRRRLRTVGE